ncbi:hypothetical protein FQZ97_717080 [compost metagenome]
MTDVEGGGDSGGNSRLVETIAANLDAAWAEVQHQRSNEQQAWMAWAQKMTAEESGSAAEAKGHATRDENWAESKAHWGGVKAAENTQRAEDTCWRSTQTADRATSQEGQSASLGQSR